MKLVKIDLKKGKGHEHPDFNTTDYFIAKIDGVLSIGYFNRQWFGWHFENGWGASGIQFDAPGYNSSQWEAVWRVVQ